jgi:hypothetical protein
MYSWRKLHIRWRVPVHGQRFTVRRHWHIEVRFSVKLVCLAEMLPETPARLWQYLSQTEIAVNREYGIPIEINKN